MNVEGLTIYHVKSHLQVINEVISKLSVLVELAITLSKLTSSFVHLLQKYRLAKYMPEKKEGNESIMKKN